MARVTVYTPTYNRAYTLEKGYKALLRQTSKDFEWLVIDDGSTDNTKQLVEGWMRENLIEIRYIYQDNQGVHVARNTAIEHTTTELNVCVDSDDYLTDDAIEVVLEKWDTRETDEFAGVIGWDIYENGEVVGKKIPLEIECSTLFDLYDVHRIIGDKKMFYRTDIVKRFPSPQFESEKYFPNKYKYTLTDDVAPCLIVHKPLCVVEYLPDGITASLFKRYYQNPKGFIFYRKFLLERSNTFTKKFRQAIHYNAMSHLICYKDEIWAKNHITPITLAKPFGLLLYYFIKFKAKKGNYL